VKAGFAVRYPEKRRCAVGLLRSVLLISAVSLSAHAQRFDAPAFQSSLDHALHNSSASAVVVDVTTGKQLTSYRLAAAPPQEPGSTLKPFVAAIGLSSGVVTPQTEVACPGTLTIGSHNLRCSHPRAITIFDLQHAIAYSCNSWFAQLAAHISPTQLSDGLRSYGLPPNVVPVTVEQRQLLALGLEGIRLTPLQLAEAYRQLAIQLRDGKFASVHSGLLDSVSYGMAHNAAVPGVTLAGKTGTAPSSGRPSTHGLFAGILYSPTTHHPVVVIVIVIPQGNGADAAALAQRFLLNWSGK
jgi:cell division protein FtsI/penicillin-binding protein 2